MSDTKNKRTASENPFYILATVYGDHYNGFDPVAHEENAALWNAWVCQKLSEHEIEDLKKTNPNLTIQDWTEDLQNTVDKAFAKRSSGPIPDHNSDIDFVDTDFEQAVDFKGFLFLKKANFMNAQFTKGADFTNAQFTNGASFMNAQFREGADFMSAQFTNGASFINAQFTNGASFMNAQFTNGASFMNAQFREGAYFFNSKFIEEAGFMNAQFTKGAGFRNAQFTKGAYFSNSKFIEEANFKDAQFAREAYFGDAQFTERANFASSRFEAHSYFQQAQFSQTLDFTDASFAQPANFRDAWFIKYYPILEGTNLHGKTTLTAKANHWPKVAEYSDDHDDLEKAASSCAYLRHNMTAQGLPDDAHFFFRREMGCKLAMAGGVKKLPLWLYEKVSDYGYSYGRPLSWLIQLWLVWTLVYTPYFLSQEQVETLATKTTALAKAAGLSFANIFAFFGFHSRFAEIEWSKASNWLIAFTGLETILGFILLFFLGLGLRNQFRLK